MLHFLQRSASIIIDNYQYNTKHFVFSCITGLYLQKCKSNLIILLDFNLLPCYNAEHYTNTRVQAACHKLCCSVNTAWKAAGSVTQDCM